MEKINIIFLVVILIYILYTFINSKQKKEQRAIKKPIDQKKRGGEADKYFYIISAVIATLMQEREHTIKRIYLTAKEEKTSPWRTTGRQEQMVKRILFKKK